MFISVIVTTYNRLECIDGLTESLLSQEGEYSDNYEIIIVDNNSTDGTKERLEEICSVNPKIRVFYEKKQGQAYAINKGLENVKGDVIALTDNDNVVTKYWINTIYRIFYENPDLKVITGKVLPIWKEGVSIPQWFSNKIKGVLVIVDYGEERKTVNYCVGCNVAYRRSVFDEFGLFNGGSRYPDVQYAARIRPYITFNYFPELVVYHHAHVERLNKAYFKKWYKENGELLAIVEGKAKGRTFLDIELWRFKEAFMHFVRSLIMWFDPRESFYHYLSFLSFVSYLNIKIKKARI